MREVDLLEAKWGSILVIGLLLISSLTRSQVTPQPVGVGAVVFFCIFAILLLFLRNKLAVLLPWTIILGLGGLIIMFIIHISLGNVGYSTLILLPYYTLFVSAFALLVIPAIVQQKVAMLSILQVSVGYGIVGIITVFLGPISIDVFAIEITAWPKMSDAPPHIPTEGALRSILSNPNFAGTLFFVGSMVSVHNLKNRNNISSLALCVFLITCLFLTQSRGSMFAFLTSFSIYLLYILCGKKLIGLAFSLVMLFCSVFILSRSGFLPTTSLFESISLSHRENLYRGAILATLDSNPLFGVGIYDTGEIASPFYMDDEVSEVIHSTYFHILLRAGMVGLCFWIIFHFGSIFNHLTQDENVNIIPVSLMSGFSVLFFFETFYPFSSTRLSVVLFCMSLGYLFYNNSNIYKIPYKTQASRLKSNSKP